MLLVLGCGCVCLCLRVVQGAVVRVPVPEGGATCKCLGLRKVRGEVLVPVLSLRSCLREVQGVGELQGFKISTGN